MSLSEAAEKWIEARGLDPELAAKFGLDSYQGTDGGEAISIPYLVGAETVNHKHRNLGQKRFHQDKDATKCFWNYNVIVDQSLTSEALIITEGEFDAIAAIQCGYVRAVSVPDGAPPQSIAEEEKPRKYDSPEHAKAGLRNCKKIPPAIAKP